MEKLAIHRNISKRLLAWKASPQRKPLVLQGPRQVGKTWLIRELGRAAYADTAYFNFDEQPDLKQFFEQTKDVGRIVENLSLVHGRPIRLGSTLLVLDEVQECNEALNSLKYFCENMPEQAVVCAGSLLGVALSQGASFPVGKVDFLEVHPVTFTEFLGVADAPLAAYLEGISSWEPLPDLFFGRLLDKFKMYMLTGGMPEAVAALFGPEGVEGVQRVLGNLLKAYSLDFSKHVAAKDIPKINQVWQSLPSQLAKENKKFLYQLVREGARAREYEDALGWLIAAGLVHRVYRCTKPGLPLSAYDDLGAFKLYLLDVGLLRRLALLEPVAVREGNRLFTEFKGALSENYVLQSLATQLESPLRYWASGGQAEVDFLMQYQGQIVPVEVKAEENVRSRSLSVYHQQFAPPLRVRFSLKNLRHDDGLLNIPLFLADHTHRLLGMKRV